VKSAEKAGKGKKKKKKKRATRRIGKKNMHVQLNNKGMTSTTIMTPETNKKHREKQ